MEPPQGPPKAGGNYPCLQSKNQYFMHYVQAEESWCPRILYLTPQDPQESRPAPLHLPEVSNNFHPLTVGCGEDPPQVEKVSHFRQGLSVLPKVSFIPLLWLLIRQPPPFFFRYSLAEGNGGVTSVRRLPGENMLQAG